MSAQKCTECGLVNFAHQDRCKRCATPLRKLNGQMYQKRDMRPVNTPTLGSFNGIGNRLLGWRHHQDGTATATAWFTFLFLPLFPLSAWRLISPKREDFEPRFSFRQLLLGLAPYKGLTTNFQIVEQLPVSGKEVLHTYLYAYVWVPFKVLAPLWLVFQFAPDPDNGSMTPALIIGSVLVVWMGYVIVMFTRLLHQTRGGM